MLNTDMMNEQVSAPDDILVQSRPIVTFNKVKQNSVYIQTNQEADAAVDAMRGKGYQKMGFAVTGPRYLPDALPCYVDMYVPGDKTQKHIHFHGNVLEHVLKRDDLDAELRSNLKDALNMFTCHAYVSCWGDAGHPWNRDARKDAAAGAPKANGPA